MQRNPTQFDDTLERFSKVWPVERVREMTIEKYANLSDHDSFCYWLEYEGEVLGAIGAIQLSKFELWKPKNRSEFDSRFTYDGTYAWKSSRGLNAESAFKEIKDDILTIIERSLHGDWKAIDLIKFHSIVKWKIAFLYSEKRLLPVYSKRALLAIAKGLGKEYSDKASVLQLQQYILSKKGPVEKIDDFTHRIYTTFAEKGKPTAFFIIGSYYGEGPYGRSVFPDMLNNECVAIGFIDNEDFSLIMGKSSVEANEFVDQHWRRAKPGVTKVKRYFRILSKIKEGDIIAIKSQGSYGKLTIIAYAQVVRRNGAIYSHRNDILGHHIHVKFLDYGFKKETGLNYAETIHQLTIKKDGDSFRRVFGWYAAENTEDDSFRLAEGDIFGDDEDEAKIGDEYEDRSEDPVTRSPIEATTMNPVHNKIQNRFLRYLRRNYPTDIIRREHNYIDAYRESDTHSYLYEIKPFVNVYACVRADIGQLLDYSHKLTSGKKRVLIVLGQNAPTQKDLQFVKYLRTVLDLHFIYASYNIETDTVVEY